MPRGAAQSSIAVIIAPDWLTKAMSPGGGARCEKLASSPIRGTMMPTQLGPTMRSRWGLAASSVACCKRPPALAQLAEAGGDDDGGAGAARAELGDQDRDAYRAASR